MASTEREQDEDQEAFLPKGHEDIPYPEKGSRNARSSSGNYIRLCLEIVMGFVIVGLLLRPLSDRSTSKRTPVPECIIFLSLLLQNK